MSDDRATDACRICGHLRYQHGPDYCTECDCEIPVPVIEKSLSDRNDLLMAHLDASEPVILRKESTPAPDFVTITISRDDAEAIIAGPKMGKAFRDASAREYEAIRAAIEGER